MKCTNFHSRFLTVLFFAIIIFSTSSKAQIWANVGSQGFSASTVGSTSIALDASGTPYVAYEQNYNATVMKYNGTSWETVGSAGFSGGDITGTCIVTDGSGTPYVAYQDWTLGGKITVMKFNGTTWINVGTPGFTTGGAAFVSLAVDPSGSPYVAFEDAANGDKTTVMKYDGSSWVTVGSTGFSTGTAEYTSLAIDGSGMPYVVYQDRGTGCCFGPATVKKYDGSSWVTVGSAGFSTGNVFFTSIAVDGSGTPYVVYSDGGGPINDNGPTTVMKYNGTSWVTVGSAGFSAGAAYYTSIAIDTSGTPYVVYEDSANGQKISVMKYDGINWVTVGSSGFSAGHVWYSTIAIDQTGTPYVC